MPDKFYSDVDQRIQRTAVNELDIKSSKNNLMYFPYKKEMKLNLVIDEINKHSNDIYMPRIISEKLMQFNLLSSDSILKKNK